MLRVSKAYTFDAARVSCSPLLFAAANTQSSVWCSRRCHASIRVGGRKTPLGFSSPLGKSPQVKQGKAQGVVRRIPGTTKVEYTNKKGRSFRFSIPITELTHPPVNAPSFNDGRWKHLDTSYCDTGELEMDMPSPVEEFLRQRLSSEMVIDGGDGASSELMVSLTSEELRQLRQRFMTFCKEYVLMDTSGMKNSMTYSELNAGPDYEHYDRKLMRKRYWLSIRRSYQMVKELLWPSDVLAGAETTAASKPGAEALTENSSGGAHSPVLSAEEMLEVLTWLHAASTFCVRAWHEYDFADRSAFEPLDLSREVKVLSQLVKDVGAFTFFQNQKAESSRVSDRLTTCIGLCHAHAVPFSVFFRSSTSTSDASFLLSHLFTHLPEGMGAAEAVRLIHAVDRLSETESLKEALYVFSSRESGEVQHSERFLGFVKLCGSCSADGLEAIQNVDEDELSVLMRFMVHLKECNREFFQLSKPLSGGGGSSRSTHATVTKGTVMEQRQVMLRFEEVCLARCRHLLYQLDGSATVVMSADENAANALPIVSLQQHRERSEVIPQTFLHYRIGMRHAQGLRRVGIRTQSSNLLELLERLNRTNDTTGSTSAHSSVTELAVDIIHHIATLSASGTKILTLHDVIRVLPILGEVLRRSPSRSAVETRYERLLLHISTTIGVELQKRPSMDVLIAILEGLAKCQWIPSTFPQLEMVVTRYCIEGDVSVRQANKVLLCMLTLRGPLSVSPALLHSIASVAQKYMASGEGGVGLGESASAVIQGDDIMPAPSDHHAYPLLELLHSLRYARYAPLPGLIAQLSERVLSNGTTGESVRIEGWDLPSRCAFGSLLAYLGTSLERQEFNNAILDKAREELRASESALPLLKPSLCMDTLLAYAALEVSFSEQSRTYVLSQCTELHSFVTPRHAVNMLNCLEVLGCQDAVLYHRYAQWLEDHCKTHSRALLDSETRQAVMDLFHLRCLPPSVKTMALKTLEEDLRRIEQERDGLQEQHGLKSSGSSFEESYLLKRDALGELDSIIMEICAVIHRAQKEEIQC